MYALRGLPLSLERRRDDDDDDGRRTSGQAALVVERVTVRGSEKSQVWQCFGFCSADSWVKEVLTSAVQIPKHYLTSDFSSPLTVVEDRRPKKGQGKGSHVTNTKSPELCRSQNHTPEVTVLKVYEGKLKFYS